MKHPQRLLQHLLQRLLVLSLALLAIACDEPPSQAPPPARVPVTLHRVEAAAFRPSVRLLGRVEPSARMELRPDAAGTIAYPPRFAGGLRTGETVARGELLFRVDSPEVGLAAAEAELQTEAAEAEVERSRQGVEGGFVSTAIHTRNRIEARIAAERLANARAAKSRLEVRAPVAGVLRVGRRVPSGSQVDPSQVVVTLAADGALRVEAWASAADLARLQPGLQAELLSPRDDSLVGRGVLIELSHSVDDGGVARVVVGVEDDLGMPRIGEGVEIEALLPQRPDVLTVPERALLVQSGVATVYLLEPAGDGFRAASRLVITGGRHDGQVEIVDGLEAGDRVAVEGAELLADGLIAIDVAIDVDRERKPWE